MSAMHGQCLLQDSRPCCTIAYTENDLTVILVLYLISFFPLSEGNKTEPCSPSLSHRESLPNSWLLQHCKISSQNIVCTSFLVFLGLWGFFGWFFGEGGLFFVFCVFWWRFTCGWVCFLFEFPLRRGLWVSTLMSEMLLMWKRCQQTTRTEHLSPAVRKHVWKCSCQGEDRAVCAFCFCGSLLLSKTFTNSPQEPWLLVLTFNPKLFLRSCFILCVDKGG